MCLEHKSTAPRLHFSSRYLSFSPWPINVTSETPHDMAPTQWTRHPIQWWMTLAQPRLGRGWCRRRLVSSRWEGLEGEGVKTINLTLHQNFLSEKGGGSKTRTSSIRTTISEYEEKLFKGWRKPSARRTIAQINLTPHQSFLFEKGGGSKTQTSSTRTTHLRV